MKQITIKDLKEISKSWCDKREKKYSSEDIFYISSDIILNHLSYESVGEVSKMLESNDYYRNIYKDIEKNGWNNKYPARIGIGDKGEIFVHGGNHRTNILTKFKTVSVPIIFKYVVGYKEKNTIRITPNGEVLNGSEGLLPQWERYESSNRR
tara:strand:- start:34 stop:489 length:456 start_codon:yes stop_codon:yes gene_type:complete